MKKYKVTLTEEERQELDALSSKGKHAAQTVLNALILHVVFISTRHPVLTEINLRLLSVRKLLDRMIGTRGSFRFWKIIGFSDPLDKRVDRSSRYLRKIRVMLLQPVFNLSCTAVRIVGNPILDELFIRLQFSEAPLLQSKKRTEFLIGHAEELAHRHSVHARLSADLADA